MKQMFVWRVGNIPLDLHREDGKYWWDAMGTRFMAVGSRGRWALNTSTEVVATDLPSLRACIAHCFGVPIDVVRNTVRD